MAQNAELEALKKRAIAKSKKKNFGASDVMPQSMMESDAEYVDRLKIAAGEAPQRTSAKSDELQRAQDNRASKSKYGSLPDKDMNTMLEARTGGTKTYQAKYAAKESPLADLINQMKGKGRLKSRKSK